MMFFINESDSTGIVWICNFKKKLSQELHKFISLKSHTNSYEVRAFKF